jgi:protein DGCR14
MSRTTRWAASSSSSLVDSSNGPRSIRSLSLPSMKRQRQQQLQQQPRIVLSEEEYTATLESIVQREYFPDLAGLERQIAVFDRRAQGDATGAIAIRRAARQLQHHEQALADQEVFDEQEMTRATTTTTTTTMATATATATTMIRKRPRPLHRETITGFHARVTNEDDEDFNETQTEQIQAHRKYLKQVFQPTIITNSIHKHDSANDTPLLEYQMASNQFQPSTFRTSVEKSSLVHQQPAKLRNSLFFVPTPLHQQEQEQHEQSEHLEYSKPQFHRIMNGTQQVEMPLVIMPPPSTKKARTRTATSTATTTTTNTTSSDRMVPATSSSSNSSPQLSSSALVVLHDPNKNQSIVLAKQDLVEYIPKHSLEKKIQPSETRFPSSSMMTTMTMGFGNHTSRIVPFPGGDDNGDIASMINYYTGGTTTDDASTDLDTDSSFSRVSSTLARERQLRENKRRRDQNTFVTMTPLIVPGRGGGNDSPVMTWGTVASTPLLLSSSGHEKEPPQPPSQQQERQYETTSHDDFSVSSFSIAAESQRDRVARKAQEQLEQRAKRIKDIKGSSSRRSSSSSSSKNNCASVSSRGGGGSQTREQQLLRSLTPAARSLMERTTVASKRTIHGSSSSFQSLGNNNKNMNHNTTQTLLRPSSRARDAFGSALRGSYSTFAAGSTPTTIPRHNRARDHADQATPQASQYQRATSNATPRNKSR